MKFSFEKIVEVPVEFLFRDVSDFDRSVVAAQRRGIEVTRTDRLTEPGIGMTWDAVAKIRKRPRNFNIATTRYDNFLGYSLRIKAGIFVADVDVECIALAKSRSRLATKFELSPLNLRGRLLLQSLKLARGRITARSSKAIEDYAKNAEERFIMAS